MRRAPQDSRIHCQKGYAMLCSTRKMEGWKLVTRDCEIGQAREVYLDDQRWVIRHVVADTGGWLLGRKVLISPHAIERLDPEQGLMEVALTQQQIKDAPDVDTDKPVSTSAGNALLRLLRLPLLMGRRRTVGGGGKPHGSRRISTAGCGHRPRRLAGRRGRAPSSESAPAQQRRDAWLRHRGHPRQHRPHRRLSVR